jgi:hypothetical protein
LFGHDSLIPGLYSSSALLFMKVITWADHDPEWRMMALGNRSRVGYHKVSYLP